MAKRESHLTEAQQKWMTSVRASMKPETGRSLEQWAEIARACPETRPRARLQWMKTQHGLGQNRAMAVFAEAFPDQSRSRENMEAANGALWADPGARAVLEAVQAAACSVGEVTEGARKSFTAWSRRVQFAAAKPATGGAVLLGLAVPPDASPRLQPAGKEGWSERLASKLHLERPDEVDGEVRDLLRRAFDAA